MRGIDDFSFTADPASLQEAFLTWLEVSVEGNRAIVHGERYDLELIVESPKGATFTLESLDEECAANAKPDVLGRLAVDLPSRRNVKVRVRMSVLAG